MSTTSSKIIIAFDLYGTLLSTASIAAELSKLYGEDKGPALAATWRRYQLEYTWRLNSMSTYIPFSDVTQRSLQHTIAEAGLSITTRQIEHLMHAYDSLSTFPDVGPALSALKSEKNITPVVFSNGTDDMVSASVHRSPDLAGYKGVFEQLVTVEEVGAFKPDPRVYEYLAKTMGKDSSLEEDMGSMWLVSGNPFDVTGARAVGMQAAWVDREGKGWVDKLGREPTAIVKRLGEVVQAVRRHGQA